MTSIDIAPAVKQFIRCELAPDVGDGELRDDVSLLDSGILDSLGIMTLLSFIESSFGVHIPVEQIEPANFETVTSISVLIASMRGEA